MPNAPATAEQRPLATDVRVAIVVSVYNAGVTRPMLEGALHAFSARGGDIDRVSIVEVPGAFELVAVSSAAVRSGGFDAVVALGCVIRGETDHDRYINTGVAHGIAQLAAETGVPVAFGVLTVADPAHARARAVPVGELGRGSGSNKGIEAMDAALDAVEAISSLRDAVAAGRPVRFELSGGRADKSDAGAAEREATA